MEFVWNFPNQPSQLKATLECGEKLEKKIVDKCQQMDPRGTARHAHQLRLFLEWKQFSVFWITYPWRAGRYCYKSIGSISFVQGAVYIREVQIFQFRKKRNLLVYSILWIPFLTNNKWAKPYFKHKGQKYHNEIEEGPLKKWKRH